MADMMQDPAANPEMPPGAPQDGANNGYEICISVGADGKISVGVESAADEAAEEAGAAAQDAPKPPAMMPVGSIREAMQMAMGIFEADGEMPSGGDDDEFDAGFGPKGKSPMMDKMSMEGE